MRRVLESMEAAPDQEHIRMIVDCNPHVPDRTDFILAHDEDPRPALLKMVKGLERAGAELLVMPCNTAHQFLPDLLAVTAIPILDWPPEVARDAAVEGVRRAGILATSGTLATGIYGRALDRFDIEAVMPSEGAQHLLMQSIFKINIRASAMTRSLESSVPLTIWLAGQSTVVCSRARKSLGLAAGDQLFRVYV